MTFPFFFLIKAASSFTYHINRRDSQNKIKRFNLKPQYQFVFLFTLHLNNVLCQHKSGCFERVPNFMLSPHCSLLLYMAYLCFLQVIHAIREVGTNLIICDMLVYCSFCNDQFSENVLKLLMVSVHCSKIWRLSDFYHH